MKTKIKGYSYWIGLISGLVGIIAFIIPVLTSKNYELFFAVGVIAVLSFFILWENIHLKKNWQRRKKYVEEMKTLMEAYAQLSPSQNLFNNNPEQYKNKVINFCSRIADFFSRVTNTECSVSVKTFTGDIFKQDFAFIPIETHSRDSRSQIKRVSMPYQTAMTMENNFDFKTIATNIRNNELNERHYMSNNLIISATKRYTNSRFGHDFYRIIESHNGSNLKKVITKIWPLPYKSTIVVGIYPWKPEQNTIPLPGFLCIDANDTDVFLECDIEILYGLADALYNYRHYLVAAETKNEAKFHMVVNSIQNGATLEVTDSKDNVTLH